MICAKVIADSKSFTGKRITTFELEYPRWIHSEFMTHRAVSKNSASSRAIPISVTISQIQSDPALPVYWGKNQSGMTAKEELGLAEIEKAKDIWLQARDSAISYAQKLNDLGLHKQTVNRILEPWIHMKVVATATDWDNLFHLRCHPDAQPEFQALAYEMLSAYQNSVPVKKQINEWHLPYITKDDLAQYSLDDCLKLSSSLCAQLSYRKSDESLDKAIMIYDKLVSSTPVHASPFEHQARPAMSDTHRSGNFVGWIQYRQTIPHNVCSQFKPHNG
jgi:hypothetical protein